MRYETGRQGAVPIKRYGKVEWACVVGQRVIEGFYTRAEALAEYQRQLREKNRERAA
jgi:hypothetical protein